MVVAHPIAQSVDIHGDDNYTRGCAFSPDATCVLSCTAADNTYRLYNVVLAATTLSPSQEDGWRSSQKTVSPKLAQLREEEVGEGDFDKNEKDMIEQNTNCQLSTNIDYGASSRSNNSNCSAECRSALPWTMALSTKECDSIRDYAWYPKMNSYDANSCIFVSTCR